MAHLVDSCETAIALLDFAFLPGPSLLPVVPPPPPAAALFLDPPPPGLVGWGLPVAARQRSRFTRHACVWVVPFGVKTTIVKVRTDNRLKLVGLWNCWEWRAGMVTAATDTQTHLMRLCIICSMLRWRTETQSIRSWFMLRAPWNSVGATLLDDDAAPAAAEL